MKSILRTAALAALSVLLCLLPACGSERTADTTTVPDTTAAPVETAAPAQPIVLVSGGQSEYVVVRPENASQDVTNIAIELYQAFAKAGVNVSITTDWEKKGADPADRPKKEILVGETNREESVQVKENLLINDYSVETVNDKIVICGGNDAATITACRLFTNEYLYLGDKISDLTIERGQLFSYTGNYAVSKLTIGGHDISEYTIAYTDSKYQDAAAALQAGITDACGRVLPIAALNKTEGQKIIVGMPADKAAIAPCTGEQVLALEKDSLVHAIEQKDGTLVLAGATVWAAGDAVKAFVADNLTGKTGEVAISEINTTGEMIIDVPIYQEATMRIMTYNVYGTNGDYAARFPYVVETIKQYLPDIIGMQEANDKVHSEVIDQLSDVYAQVDKFLEGNDIITRTPILYRKDKYKVLEADCVFLRSRYTGTNTKSIAWAVFESIETGERFIMTNLHGALIADSYNVAGTNSVEGAAWRVDNIAQMVEKLTELKAKYGELPTFSTGDFNFNEDAQAYKDAIAAGLSDAEKTATVSRVTGTKTTHTVGETPVAGKSIDHIFINDKVNVLVHDVIRDADALKGSDHCAVYADVKLK